MSQFPTDPNAVANEMPEGWDHIESGLANSLSNAFQLIGNEDSEDSWTPRPGPELLDSAPLNTFYSKYGIGITLANHDGLIQIAVAMEGSADIVYSASLQEFDFERAAQVTANALTSCLMTVAEPDEVAAIGNY